MIKPQRIRWIFACLAFPPLLLLIAGLSNPHEKEIRSVIQQQLNAFNQDDYDTAYSFASRHIQTEFSRPEFEQMVKSGYRQIAKSRRAKFDRIRFTNGENRALAAVIITGMDRITITANYRMVRENGKWKIDGVRIVSEQTPIADESS
jgi:Domain of unknown function (DUF4864)